MKTKFDMIKIKEKFAELRQRGEKALIAYISCGDPSADETVKIADELIDAGVDILELGLPFSDPIADGPTIQAASQRALSKGMNTDRYFKTVARIEGVPKVCMTYYNLIFQYGLERFCKRCYESGITGLIVPDLPLEEAGDLRKACRSIGIDLILIASPQNGKERIKKIAKKSAGFVYIQSTLGVTGARSGSFDITRSIASAKMFTKLPIAVGFGVSEPRQVSELVRQGADGVIIGSAIIDKIQKNRARVGNYIRSLKAATNV